MASQQQCACNWPSDSIFYEMCEFTGCPTEQATPLNTNASLAPPIKEPELELESACSSTRFHYSDDKQLKELAEGVRPENTAKATKWALNVYHEWCESRNSQSHLEPVPELHLMESENPAELCKYLSMLVVEVRKKNGEKYPPATLHQLLCGLLRHMRGLNSMCPNFLDKGDKRFKQLHNTLDAYFHNLHADGIGIKVNHAEIITQEEEAQLWSSGIMSLNNPASLQNAVFYTVGKMFCLRGGMEHRSLKISQFIRLTDPDHYIYHENTSKNRNGSFKQLHIKPKVVPLYAVPEAGDRCPVNILDTYIDKLPKDAFKKDLFYVRPLAKLPCDENQPWYTSVPVGKNMLNNKVKTMCNKARIEGNKTNHSLRATGATALFESGIPEKVIQERTGHRSVEALRTYEHISEKQHIKVSSILSAASTRHLQREKKSDIAIPDIPSISFGELHSCTINITNCPPTCSSMIERSSENHNIHIEN